MWQDSKLQWPLLHITRPIMVSNSFAPPPPRRACVAGGPAFPAQSLPTGSGQLCFASQAACGRPGSGSCKNGTGCVLDPSLCNTGAAAGGAYPWICSAGALSPALRVLPTVPTRPVPTRSGAMPRLVRCRPARMPRLVRKQPPCRSLKWRGPGCRWMLPAYSRIAARLCPRRASPVLLPCPSRPPRRAFPVLSRASPCFPVLPRDFP